MKFAHLNNIWLLTLVLPILAVSCAIPTLPPVIERSSVDTAESKDTTGSNRIVKKGDTLYSIAWQAGLDYKSIAKVNGISPPYLIQPGQSLNLSSATASTTVASATASNSTPAQTPQPTPSLSSSSSSSSSPVAPPSQQVSSANIPSSKPVATKPKPTSQPKPKPKPQLEVRPVKGSIVGWMWPTRGVLINRFSRKNGINGIRIAARTGTSVNATKAGEVVYTGQGLRGYGKLVIVKHSSVYLSAYAHNSKLLVKEGQKIKKGQPIAKVGSSGAERAMLHFEIRKNGKPVDPLRYLPKSLGST